MWWHSPTRLRFKLFEPGVDHNCLGVFDLHADAEGKQPIHLCKTAKLIKPKFVTINPSILAGLPFVQRPAHFLLSRIQRVPDTLALGVDPLRDLL
jgi:hypothetical protein